MRIRREVYAWCARNVLFAIPILAITAALMKLRYRRQVHHIEELRQLQIHHSDTQGVTWGEKNPRDLRARPSPLNKHHISLTNHRVISRLHGVPLYIHRAFQDDRSRDTYIRIFGVEKVGEVAKDGWLCRWTVLQGGVSLTKEVKAKKYLVFPSSPAEALYVAVNFDCHLPGRLLYQLDRMELVSTSIRSKDSLTKGISTGPSLGGDRSVEVPLERTLVSSPRKGLAVCVIPTKDSTTATRLVEWIELQQVTGINHFLVYDTGLRGSVRLVLEYYQSLGIVTVISFPFLMALLNLIGDTAEDARAAIHSQVHLLARADALYRFHGTYAYLQMTDVDQVFLPSKEEDNWAEMVRDMHTIYPKAAGFVFPSAYHFVEALQEATHRESIFENIINKGSVDQNTFDKRDSLDLKAFHKTGDMNKNILHKKVSLDENMGGMDQKSFQKTGGMGQNTLQRIGGMNHGRRALLADLNPPIEAESGSVYEESFHKDTLDHGGGFDKDKINHVGRLHKGALDYGGGFDKNTLDLGEGFPKDTLDSGRGFDKDTLDPGGGFHKDTLDHGGGFHKDTLDHGGGFDKDTSDHGGGFHKDTSDHSGGFHKDTSDHSGGFDKDTSDHGGGFHKDTSDHSGGFHKDTLDPGGGFDKDTLDYSRGFYRGTLDHGGGFNKDISDHGGGFLYMQKYHWATPPGPDASRSVVVTRRALSLSHKRVVDVPSKQYVNVEPSWKAYGYLHKFPGTCARTLTNRTCADLLPRAQAQHVLRPYKTRVEVRVKKVLSHLKLKSVPKG